MLDLNWHPSRRELRQFALLCLLFGAVVGGLILYRTGSWSVPVVLWGVSLIVAALGTIDPALVRPVYIGWMAAAYPIGWIISTAVLALTFYVVVMPIGLLMRAISHDPLGRREHRSPGSYWVPHEPPRDPASYFRQF